MRIAVYTAIFGDIDHLWSAYPLAWGASPHYCFSDHILQEVGLWTDERPARIMDGTGGLSAVPTWKVKLVEPEWSPRRTARHYKAVPHRYIDADVWVWVDGNVRLLAPPEMIVDKYLAGADLAIFRHPDRKCLYDEAGFCAEKGKDSPTVLREQTNKYAQMGMPHNWGLPETRCVIRRNTPQMREMGDMWWDELRQHSVRDQVSLPFVCWKMGIRWREIPGRCWVRNKHPHFYYMKHRGKR